MRGGSLLPLLLFLVSACTSSSPTNETPDVANAPSGPVNPGESPASKATPKNSGTEIVLGLDAEGFVSEGYKLTSYTIEARVDGVVAASETLDVGESDPLPHETRLLAPANRLDARVEIVTKAVMNSATVVTRRVTTSFVPGKVKLAYVMLEVRCNEFGLLGGGVVGPTCDKPGETCIGAQCRSDVLAELPDYRREWAKNPPSACGAGTASSISIGEGERTRTPLADGATVTFECGPQGGHHLWLALDMRDISQSGTTTTVTASIPGGPTLPATGFPYAWSSIPTGGCELVGLRYQVDLGGVKVSELLGRPLDLTVEAKDKSGRKATATRHLNVAPTRLGMFCMPL